MLAVDPLGIVGDGGRAAFGAELKARTPKDRRKRGRLLDEQVERGERTPEEAAVDALAVRDALRELMRERAPGAATSTA